MAKNATDKLKSAVAYLRATEGKGLIAAYADTYGNVLHDAEAVLVERVFTESEVKAMMEDVAHCITWPEAKGVLRRKYDLILDPA